MTVNEFLRMQLDNLLTFRIFDFAKNDIIFDSRYDEDGILEVIGEYEFDSWNMEGENNEIICFNINTEED